LNCDDLSARVYLTFYERSGSRVNRHTSICWSSSCALAASVV